MDIHTTLASVGISSSTLAMPINLDLDVGVLPIPIPNTEPAGFSSPSGPSGFTHTSGLTNPSDHINPYDPLGFGRSRGPGFRAASPVTAIEELGNASSSASGSSSGAGSSREPSEDGGAVGRMSEEGSAYQPLLQQ